MIDLVVIFVSVYIYLMAVWSALLLARVNTTWLLEPYPS